MEADGKFSHFIKSNEIVDYQFTKWEQLKIEGELLIERDMRIIPFEKDYALIAGYDKSDNLVFQTLEISKNYALIRKLDFSLDSVTSFEAYNSPTYGFMIVVGRGTHTTLYKFDGKEIGSIFDSGFSDRIVSFRPRSGVIGWGRSLPQVHGVTSQI